MLGLGFTRRKEDQCVYFKLIGDLDLFGLLCGWHVTDRKQQGDYPRFENSVIL